MDKSYEILIEQGECWLWRAQTPVSRFTEREAETMNIELGTPEGSEYVEAIFDIGAAVPLQFIRPSNMHDDATTFYNRIGEGYVICVPFEDFVREYVSWLKRHPELYEDEKPEYTDE